ncbi:MAG: hypothetical protein J6K17_14780 [Oscillospiraceae bacterium]|nr:hypothetical protein [Oscillospiraceae bacterium]
MLTLLAMALTKRSVTFFMETTSNVHMNQGSVAELHNWRDIDLILAENKKNKDSFIDIYNEHGDSFHETVYRCNLREKYIELFGKAMEEYNARQSRSDRKMTIDKYMKSVDNDTRGKRQTKKVNGKRVIDESKPVGKRLSYEIITSISNTECAKDTEGKYLYDETDHQIRHEYLPRNFQREVVRRYCETFAERNPNLAVVNINIHGDEMYHNKRGEWEYGVIHSHIEFIPFAEGFKQSLSRQNSMNKALAAMGINYENDGNNRKYPYEVLCEKERKYLEELTREMYEEYCKANPDFYKENGPIHFYHPVADKSKLGGDDKETFAAKRIIEEERADIIAAQKENAEKEAYLDEREDNLDEREDNLDEREHNLDKRESDIEFSLQSKKIGLDARTEMNKQDAEKNRQDAEKNKRDAEENERVRHQLEIDRASMDEGLDKFDKERAEFEKEKEDFRQYKKRKVAEFDMIVDKEADKRAIKKAEEILQKEDMKRKNEKLGNKIYTGPSPSPTYSSNLKDRFK